MAILDVMGVRRPTCPSSLTMRPSKSALSPTVKAEASARASTVRFHSKTAHKACAGITFRPYPDDLSSVS